MHPGSRLLLLVFLLLPASKAFSGDIEIDPVRLPEAIALMNRKDPVDGKRVEAIQERWRGIAVNFASLENAAKFLEKPESYLEPLGVKLVETEAGKKDGKNVVSLENAKCPVSGAAVDRKVFVDRNGARLYFAREEHKKTFAEDPAKHLQKAGLWLLPTVVDLRNKRCPITRQQCYFEAPIAIDVEGIRVRICCGRCYRAAAGSAKTTFKALRIDSDEIKKKYPEKK